MHVIGRRSRGRGLFVVSLAVSVAVSSLRGGDAGAAEPETGPAAPDAPAPAPGGDPADVSKTECLSRYEEAQVARRERRLLDSRAALRICSRESCPAAIRADCVDWLDQVSHSLPSVVVTARARGADVLAVKVFVDGKLATERLTGFALEIDPGLHKFRFESPPWPAIEREVLATAVSAANDCFFCMDSHAAHAHALLEQTGETDRAPLLDAVKVGSSEGFDPKMQALLDISRTVRRDPLALTAADVERAGVAGASDGDVQLAVLIASAFSMYNRMVDGLRAKTSPSTEAYEARASEIAEDGYSARPAAALPAQS